MKRRTEKWKIAAGVAILILLAAVIAVGSRIIEKREKKVKKNSDYDEETSVQWTEENTLYFNGTLYGYNHELFLTFYLYLDVILVAILDIFIDKGNGIFHIP